MTIFGAILFGFIILTSPGGNGSQNTSDTQNENTVDVCRYLTEPVIRIGLLLIKMVVEMQLVKRLVFIIGKKSIFLKIRI
jgi:hypothetical protein